MTMDLGIAGKRALVCAASKGLGRGCAQALADAGCDVTIVARTAQDVERAAREIGERAGSTVAWVACDITTAEGRAAALAACPQPDILINNAGGPPPGDFRDWTRDDWIRAVDANMLTPIELIKSTIDGMIARAFRTHREHHVVGGEGADRRSGLEQRRAQRTHWLCRGARAQGGEATASPSTTCCQAHSTLRALRNVTAMRAKAQGIRTEAALDAARAAIPTRRVGRPEEFGAMCAFLCSAHAGYIVGQNILMDGGQYPGTY